MLAKVLIITHGNDLEYLNIILNMVESYTNSGNIVEILNMANVVQKQDAYNRSILKCAFIESPEVLVLEYLEDSGLTVYDAGNYVNDTIPALPSNEIKASIEESIRSTLISMSGMENPYLNRRRNKISSNFIIEAERTFQVVLNVLHAHGPYQEISVVNGRFPYQRATLEAAAYMGIRSKSFERGTYERELPVGLSTLGRYYRSINYWHEEFPANYRVRRQQEVLKRLQNDDNTSRNHVAQLWLDERRKPGGSNQFNANWKVQPNAMEPYVAFFSSSLDEFAELGPQWKEGEWESQWDAFAQTIPLFNRIGYKVILRVHPNLRNKHKSERASANGVLKNFRLEFPYLEIVNAASKIDSYKLIESASAVIVWNSTIGLESSLMGIPTACLASCEYDLVVDVERWLRKSDVDVHKLLDKSVDSSSAVDFIYSIDFFDRPLKPLLQLTELNLRRYGRGLPLFANRWNLRGNNRPINLISLILPRFLFLAIRKVVRKSSFYRT
jgi:hypothetical protein